MEMFASEITDGVNKSGVNIDSEKIALFVRDILDGMQSGDIGSIATSTLIGIIVTGFTVFGVHFFMIALDKGFWGAVNDFNS